MGDGDEAELVMELAPVKPAGPLLGNVLSWATGEGKIGAQLQADLVLEQIRHEHTVALREHDAGIQASLQEAQYKNTLELKKAETDAQREMKKIDHSVSMGQLEQQYVSNRNNLIATVCASGTTIATSYMGFQANAQQARALQVEREAQERTREAQERDRNVVRQLATRLAMLEADLRLATASPDQFTLQQAQQFNEVFIQLRFDITNYNGAAAADLVNMPDRVAALRLSIQQLIILKTPAQAPALVPA